MFKPFVSLVFLVLLAAPVVAQPVDTIGTRAQGMGGAFTAVADDATASWWNPAGMAGGAYVNALFESGSHSEPRTDRNGAGAPRNARRADTRNFAVAFPALGLSYYRLQVSQIQPQTSTGTAAGGRQEGGATEVRLRTMVLSQFSASVGQSLGSHLVVGSTLKLVNGGTTSEIQAAAAGSLDAATHLDPSGETHAGLDMGAMAVFGRARFGVMVRNVREVDFASGADAFRLSRTVRLGAAISTGTRGVVGGATVAVDGDLTTATTLFGDERRLAAGGEVWTTAKSFGLRGGVSVNTIGDRRTALSGGASAALRKGMYADGEYTGGTDLGRQGWSVGLRLTF